MVMIIYEMKLRPSYVLTVGRTGFYLSSLFMSLSKFIQSFFGFFVLILSLICLSPSYILFYNLNREDNHQWFQKHKILFYNFDKFFSRINFPSYLSIYLKVYY